jgi:hypothetical protein
MAVYLRFGDLQIYKRDAAQINFVSQSLRRCHLPSADCLPPPNLHLQSQRCKTQIH